jgi:hypothetical protein
MLANAQIRYKAKGTVKGDLNEKEIFRENIRRSVIKIER